MSFPAKYEGHCAHEDCTEPSVRIEPGDEVRYVGDELMHRSCSTRVRTLPPLCGDCWTHHRGECL